VRCARCGTSWFAKAELVDALPAVTQAPPNWPPGLRYIDPGSMSAPEAAFSADVELASSSTEIVARPPDEILAGSSQRSPASTSEAARPSPTPSEDIETVAARHARLARAAQRKPRRRPGIGTMIAIAASVVTALLAWRTEIVRLLPQTARLYAAIGMPVNLRGLDIRDVKISGDTHEGVPVLVIEGNVVSKLKQTAQVPRLRFALRSKSGVEVYAWTTQAQTPVLAAGEILPFRTRLASPPGDARDVVVRFLHRRDL
jgi:hypothetical protein